MAKSPRPHSSSLLFIGNSFTQRNNLPLDIRGHQDWMTTAHTMKTVADLRRFRRRGLGRALASRLVRDGLRLGAITGPGRTRDAHPVPLLLNVGGAADVNPEAPVPPAKQPTTAAAGLATALTPDGTPRAPVHPRLQEPPIGPSGTLDVPVVTTEARPFRTTLILVLAVQVVSLLLLWLLQARYTH